MSTKTITYEAILTDVADGVATITLNRPERMNAYTWRMGAELHHAFAAFDADPDVRAIVVTGAGKAFCAGADLERGADTFGARGFGGESDAPDELNAPHAPPWEMATPIIAAINGHAVGVGITLPMQWDIRIAAEDAKIGFVFNQRGIVPEANSMWLVPRLIGFSKALELLMTGRIISGAEAAELGVVNKALPRDDVLPAAQEIGREIATNCAPASVAITKKLMYRFLMENDRDAAHALEGRAYRWTGTQPDSREGVTAFLEKRKPEWKVSKADLPEEVR